MWKIIQYAATGRNHERYGIPCQDKTFSCEKNGIQVMALSDGAGSAKLSQYGADTITKKICDIFLEKFDKYYNNQNGVAVKISIVESLLHELSICKKSLNCNLDDLSATMLFVAIKKERFIIGHIGDGVIGYLKNNTIKVATTPQNGEFANTTVFVTSSGALKTFQLIKGTMKNNIDGFVLMSDGSETSFYDKKKKTLAKGLQDIMNLLKITNYDKFKRKFFCFMDAQIRFNTLDDCSIAIIVNDHGKNFFRLDKFLKAELLGISFNDKILNKKIKQYELILNVLSTPHTKKELTKLVHIKNKYLTRKITKLLKKNLIESSKDKYITMLS